MISETHSQTRFEDVSALRYIDLLRDKYICSVALSSRMPSCLEAGNEFHTCAEGRTEGLDMSLENDDATSMTLSIMVYLGGL